MHSQPKPFRSSGWYGGPNKPYPADVPDKTGRMESGNGFTGLLAWSSPSANLVGVWKSDPARSGFVPSYIFALIISLSDADLPIANIGTRGGLLS